MQQSFDRPISKFVLRSEIADSTAVQFHTSDFGFEMQESSDFKISVLHSSITMASSTGEGCRLPDMIVLAHVFHRSNDSSLPDGRIFSEAS